MKSNIKQVAGALCAGMLVVGPARAEVGDYGQGRDEAGYAAATLDARVARLEKRMAGQPLAEMSREIDRLQAEIKSLRGLVEELRNGLDKTRRLEKEHFAETERRHAELESRLTLASPPPAGAPALVAPGLPTPPAAGADPGIPPVPGAPGAVAAPLDPAIGQPLATANPQGAPAATAPTPGPEAAFAPPPPPPPDPMARQRDYEKAFETLKASRYTDAIAEFQTFVAKYPSGEFSDSAHYWLGEAHYVNRDFVAAREAFKKMATDFPQSVKVPDALLKLGFIEYENADFAKARGLLTDLVKRYPESSAARMAEKRLERMRQEGR